MGDVLLKCIDVMKRYGNTLAVNKVSLSLAPGDTLGLVGANGAGKSTLMRLLSGVTRLDAGKIEIGDKRIDTNNYTPSMAAGMGIRVVYQELSLFSNLSVYENFFIEQAKYLTGLSWRAKAKEKTRAALDAVFPGSDIKPTDQIIDLPIAQRQMVEIARAASDENLRLLILDEPTSSLGARETDRFMESLSTLSGRGVAIIYISHRLDEVMRLSNKITILRNGGVIWDGLANATTKAELVERMADSGDGSALPVLRESRAAPPPTGKASGSISLRKFTSGRLRDISVELRGGMIYGIAGLEGSGQKEFLRALFSHDASGTVGIAKSGRMAYVSGDRKKEGIFPLWDLFENIRLGSLGGKFGVSKLDDRADRTTCQKWYDRLQVKAEGLGAGIASLSGGNQQKILIARAMVSEADIILLDDPTRGVDVGTKNQLYALFREAAAAGKLVIWHSTEDDEFSVCDTVLVMRYGKIVKELSGDGINKDAIIKASFSSEDNKDQRSQKKQSANGGIIVPLAAMLLVYIVSGILAPEVFSLFGAELLLGGSLPLVLAALSQMYIIGFSHINMGVGAFMGLINVLGATWLQQNYALGWGSVLLALILYTAAGILIEVRKIPAIIVTLGTSFIWTGIAYSIQASPGGQAPGWLVTLFSLNLPLLPTVIYWLALSILAAILVSRSRYGTVLKAAGNNPVALERSGWSLIKAIGAGYFISGLFCAAGGLFITAITTASDANSAASYTLLTVAAVVMGGGELVGGRVTPLGAALGAITLSLLGSLLGFMNISSNYVTLVQGLILVAILAMRLLRRSNRHAFS